MTFEAVPPKPLTLRVLLDTGVMVVVGVGSVFPGLASDLTSGAVTGESGAGAGTSPQPIAITANAASAPQIIPCLNMISLLFSWTFATTRIIAAWAGVRNLCNMAEILPAAGAQRAARLYWVKCQTCATTFCA